MMSLRFRRAFIALPLVFAVAACEDSGTEPTPATALRLDRVRGNNQQVRVDAVANDSLSVRVLGANNVPVAGAEVTWNVLGSNGQLSSTTVRADQFGVASVQYSGATVAGRTEVTAQSSGADPISFFVEVTAGAPATSERVSAEQLTVAPNGAVTARLRVRDQYGNGVPGAQVSFRIIGGTAADVLDLTTVSTDETGLAFVTFFPGSTSGLRTLEATTPSGTISFNVNVMDQ